MPLSSDDALNTWALEREVVLSKVIAAPRERVFQAWSDPRQLPLWFGPNGFTIETHEIDLRAGGIWRFTMIGPDGTRYESRSAFLSIDAPRLFVFNHGSDKDDDPGKFRMTITFDEQRDGKTVVTLRQMHPTREQRDMVVSFGAVEFGYQTLDKLAAHVGGAV